MVSYFGLSLGQIDPAEAVEGPGIPIAMPLDLAGCKVAVVTQRAEARDYVDIHALLSSGLSLAEMLGAARAIYGSAFSPLTALKALTYFDEPTLATLSEGIRRDLASAASRVDPTKLPAIVPVRPPRSRT